MKFTSNRRAVFACLALGVLALGSLGARRAVGGPDPSESVKTINRAIVQAVLKQDRPVLERLLADDLTYVHGDGQIRGKRAFIDELGKHLTYRGIEVEQENVRTDGALAVLSATVKFHVFEHGGDAHTVTKITRVFVRSAKGKDWQLALHQATRLPTPKPKAP